MDSDFESETERETRLKRAVVLPRLTSMKYTKDGAYRGRWGSSLDDERRKSRAPAKMEYRIPMRPTDQRATEARECSSDIEATDDILPQSESKKTEWMSGSLVTVGIAIAALVGLIVVVKYLDSSKRV